jgi:hypothetical protein
MEYLLHNDVTIVTKKKFLLLKNYLLKTTI